MDAFDKWDIRFLRLAQTVSSWSKDPSTLVGAVIARPDRTVASVGYNGFPRGMTDLPEYYEKREEKYSRIIHAEVNALLHARERVVGYTLYTYPLMPCDRCMVQMIQAGFKRIVSVELSPEHYERWGATLNKSMGYASDAGIELLMIPKVFID